MPLTSHSFRPCSLLTFLPGAIGFGSQNVGTSASLQLGITNYGTSPVSFSSFAISGKNAADFTIISNSCPFDGGHWLRSQAPQSASRLHPPPPAFESPRSRLPIMPPAARKSSPFPVPAYRSPSSSLSLTAPSAFGAQTIGVSSGVGTFYAQSVGAGAVTISNIAVGGTNASDFSIYNANCLPALIISARQSVLCPAHLHPHRCRHPLRHPHASLARQRVVPQSISLEGVGEILRSATRLQLLQRRFRRSRSRGDLLTDQRDRLQLRRFHRLLHQRRRHRNERL